MTNLASQGSARHWGGVSQPQVSLDITTPTPSYTPATPQKRPPGGRVGRCPAGPGGGLS